MITCKFFLLLNYTPKCFFFPTILSLIEIKINSCFHCHISHIVAEKDIYLEKKKILQNGEIENEAEKPSTGQ